MDPAIMEIPKHDDREEVIIHEGFVRKVVRIDNNRVVKSGQLGPQEPDALRFVSENTTIPVPKLHEVRWKDGKIDSFVMDYMPGTRLDYAWDSLSTEQKLNIANELNSYAEQLRALKGDYIGAPNNGQAIVGQRAKVEGGPFKTEKEFNDFLLGDISSKLPDCLRHYCNASLYDGHEIVFMHNDLEPRKVLVEDGHVTAVIDWEYAGWYPEWWDYGTAYQYTGQVSGWADYLAIILPPKYEKELIGYSYLCSYLMH